MGLSLLFALITMLPLQSVQPPAARPQAATYPPYQETQSQQLMRAVRANNLEETKALLASGANPSGDPLGRNPVLTAMENDNFEIVRVLAKAGANLNYIDGPALLVSAVEHGNVQMVKRLLSLGARVNGTGIGETPLHSALGLKRTEIVKVLIAAGADTKTEMENAERYKQSYIIRPLQEALGIVPAPIPPAEMVSELEVQWQWKDTSYASPNQMPPRDVDVDKTWQELAARLKASPQDRATLLLWARLLLADSFNNFGKKQPASPTAEEALDRVLAADPHDAEALYYKGRLYGFPVQVSKHAARRRDVDKAVEYMRLAVKYAPEKEQYRTVLAYFLADQGHPGEAKAILQAAHQNAAMVPLLADLESLPVPPNAELLAQHEVSTMLMLGMALDGIGGDSLLRTRAYVVQQDHSEIETFYRAHWPGFKWIPTGGGEIPKAPDNRPPTAYVQFLVGSPDAWAASSNLDEITRKSKTTSGILMVFTDLRTYPETAAELDPGEPSRFLVILDYRRDTAGSK